MIKKILLLLLVLLVLLVGVLFWNTIRFTPQQKPITQAPLVQAGDSSIKHFQQAIRFKTISYSDSTLFDSSQFLGFHQYLSQSYPLVHRNLKKEVINQYTLLYEWKGKNPELKPVILMAHQDVVPVEEATLKSWSVPPFEGILKENAIWGRGTTDDKINLISILEAAEQLLREGYQPNRTVYFVFGHDEEVSGQQGAAAVAKLLVSRKVEAEFVLDEGGFITLERVPGMQNKPIALIGTAEKGYMSLQLTVEIPGGHSSMPEKEVCIDILSKALNRLREKPFPARFSEASEGFFEQIGPHMPFPQKLVIANRWLFKPVLVSLYEKTPAGNAMIRTTAVPTILESGLKDNVVPTVAKAVVNCRLLPGDSSEEVLRQIREIVDDERVKIGIVGNVSEPSPVTSLSTLGYQTVVRQIGQNRQGTIAVPFLMIGATDSRHFTAVSNTILKFSPMQDPFGFHGTDEHVTLDSYQHCISFYHHLLKELE